MVVRPELVNQGPKEFSVEDEIDDAKVIRTKLRRRSQATVMPPGISQTAKEEHMSGRG